MAEINLVNIVSTSGNNTASIFKGTGIKKVILPNVVNVGSYIAYQNNDIQYVLIGDKCATFDQYTYRSHANTLLASIILANTPPTLNNTPSMWGQNGGLKPIYVPDDSVDSYKTATYWSTVQSSIRPLSSFVSDFPNSGLEEYLP